MNGYGYNIADAQSRLPPRGQRSSALTPYQTPRSPPATATINKPMYKSHRRFSFQGNHQSSRDAGVVPEFGQVYGLKHKQSPPATIRECPASFAAQCNQNGQACQNAASSPAPSVPGGAHQRAARDADDRNYCTIRQRSSSSPRVKIPVNNFSFDHDASPSTSERSRSSHSGSSGAGSAVTSSPFGQVYGGACSNGHVTSPSKQDMRPNGYYNLRSGPLSPPTSRHSPRVLSPRYEPSRGSPEIKCCGINKLEPAPSSRAHGAFQPGFNSPPQCANDVVVVQARQQIQQP